MDIPVSKVIIHKLSGEVSLLEQDKIENISYSQVSFNRDHLKFIIIFKIFSATF